jgi:hypothetical protein
VRAAAGSVLDRVSIAVRVVAVHRSRYPQGFGR